MPLRRTVLAFVVALVCALAVFTLPRFAWNTVQAALRPQPASADTSGPVAAAAPAARGAPQAPPRSLGQLVTGLLGIVFILVRRFRRISRG